VQAASDQIPGSLGLVFAESRESQGSRRHDMVDSASDPWAGGRSGTRGCRDRRAGGGRGKRGRGGAKVGEGSRRGADLHLRSTN
jgi:hypothetical protein